MLCRAHVSRRVFVGSGLSGGVRDLVSGFPLSGAHDVDQACERFAEPTFPRGSLFEGLV